MASKRISHSTAIILMAIVVLTAGCVQPQNRQPATFPAYSLGRTEDNKEIYDIELFKVNIVMPTGWHYQQRKHDKPEGEGMFPVGGVWTVLDIMNADGKNVGAIGYNIFDPDEVGTLPQGIYSQIALGNGYHFDAQREPDGAYRVVSSTSETETAVTKVYYSAQFAEGIGLPAEEKTNIGVLSYNSRLKVYVAMEIDASIDPKQVEEMAESIELVRK